MDRYEGTLERVGRVVAPLSRDAWVFRHDNAKPQHIATTVLSYDNVHVGESTSWQRPGMRPSELHGHLSLLCESPTLAICLYAHTNGAQNKPPHQWTIAASRAGIEGCKGDRHSPAGIFRAYTAGISVCSALARRRPYTALGPIVRHLPAFNPPSCSGFSGLSRRAIAAGVAQGTSTRNRTSSRPTLPRAIWI